jgi:hypothetical protein
MWPRILVVLHELTEHVLKVVTTQDQQVIQVLAPVCPTHLSANEFARGADKQGR